MPVSKAMQDNFAGSDPVPKISDRGPRQGPTLPGKQLQCLDMLYDAEQHQVHMHLCEKNELTAEAYQLCLWTIKTAKTSSEVEIEKFITLGLAASAEALNSMV